MAAASQPQPPPPPYVENCYEQLLPGNLVAITRFGVRVVVVAASPAHSIIRNASDAAAVRRILQLFALPPGVRCTQCESCQH